MFTLKDEASPRVSRGEVEGNKALDYPVGLITADEISVAGGALDTSNTNYYLYKSSNYFTWILSPHFRRLHYAHMFIVLSNGALSGINVNYSYMASANPVINLSADYAVTLNGSGTITDPYVLS